MELSKQCWLDSFTGLVARPELVTKRLDDVIRCHANVRCSLFDHLQHTVEHAQHGAERLVFPFIESALPVEMTKEFVGAVDEMDDHGEEVMSDG